MIQDPNLNADMNDVLQTCKPYAKRLTVTHGDMGFYARGEYLSFDKRFFVFTDSYFNHDKICIHIQWRLFFHQMWNLLITIDFLAPFNFLLIIMLR